MLPKKNKKFRQQLSNFTCCYGQLYIFFENFAELGKFQVWALLQLFLEALNV